MKKYLALILGVLFVLSFAASAFAIHAEIPSETQAVVAKTDTQITLGGEIRVRGWYAKNIGTAQSLDIVNDGFATEADFGIDVNGDGDLNDAVEVLTQAPGKLASTKLPERSKSQAYYDQRVRLTLDAKISPNVEGFVMLETGAGQSDTYTWGNFNSKPTDMHINEAWILYTGSGLFGFSSGVKIGHMPLALGNKEFFDHTKFGDDAIVFFMDPIKPLHVALLSVKFAGDGSPSVISSFGNLDASGSRFDNTDDLDGYVALMTYKVNDNTTVGVNYTYLNQSQLGLSHQNLGVHANGNIGPVGYTAAGDIQFGKLKAADEKFRGYALQLGINFNVNPVNIRASAAMGSGDSNAGDNKNKTFVTYLGADQHYTLIYEYQVVPAGGYTSAGLSNTTYGNLGVDFNATKDLALSLDGYYLRATKTESGISKNAGWEVDAKLKYALAKNLTYQVDAGYFKSGNFYDDTYGIDNKGVTLLRNSLTLSF